MTLIQSIDAKGHPSWTPVPDGYPVERVIEILTFAGHTEITTVDREVAA